MRIRNLEIKSRVFLAPMLEYNDIAFRELCLEAGAGLTWTGMINPLTKQELRLEDKPILQLFCNSEKGISEFVNKHDEEVSGWDFNLGCPSKKSFKSEIGAFMNLDKAEEILKQIRENTSKPLIIKIRKSKHTFKILKIAEKYCDAICIHPRTREQGYSGKADVDFALRLKKKSKIPVIYSGDVNKENIPELLKKFDFVMIARACLGNTSVFGKSYEFKDYLKLARKYHLGMKEIKIHALAFTKGKQGASEIREKITKAKTMREIINLYKSEQ